MPVVVLPTDVGGIEHHAEQFLWIERSCGLLQSFPLPVVRSYDHHNTVASRADQLEIGQRENRRRIDKNDFEQVAATPHEFLPARAGEKVRRGKQNRAWRQNDKSDFIAEAGRLHLNTSVVMT